MKKLAVLGVVALSVSGLYAADPQPDAAPQPPSPPDAVKPLPPLDGENGPGPHHKKFDWRQNRKDEGKRGHEGRDFPRGPRGAGRPGHGPGGEGHPKFGQGEMLAKALNLTDDQKAKAKAIMEATKPKIEAIRSEGREKVKAVIADSMQELRPILTPEQQAVLDDLQKLRADRAALQPVQKSGKPGKTDNQQ